MDRAGPADDGGGDAAQAPPTDGNEIKAIPELLATLDIAGATITLDAMGCQRDIVPAITAGRANYIIAVKNNPPPLAQAIEGLFTSARHTDPCELPQDITLDKGHARLNTRRCVVQTDLHDKGQVSTDWRYYISSCALTPAQFNRQIHPHWQIENGCHWVLDVIFDEDASRIRRDHGAENMALLRRISLNLIKQDKATKGSIKLKRKRAGWSNDYLEHLLGLKAIA